MPQSRKATKSPRMFRLKADDLRGDFVALNFLRSK